MSMRGTDFVSIPLPHTITNNDEVHLAQQTPLQFQVQRFTRKVLMRIGSTQDYTVLQDKKMAGLSFQKEGFIRALRENYQ